MKKAFSRTRCNPLNHLFMFICFLFKIKNDNINSLLQKLTRHLANFGAISTYLILSSFFSMIDECVECALFKCFTFLIFLWNLSRKMFWSTFASFALFFKCKVWYFKTTLNFYYKVIFWKKISNYKN